MNHIEESRKFRKAMLNIAHTLDDAKASTAPDMFPRLKGNGELVRSGVRINWNGTVKKADVDLWDTAENNPDNAPNLWADLNYRDGFRIIPEIITVTTVFAEGECGWWNDKLYRSNVNGNVYTPAVYPDNWEMVEI